MKSLFKASRVLLLLICVTSSLALTGCETTDPENASVRPWNTPQSWETGLPSGLTEGR